MPKKAIRTPESEEEVESKPVLDSDSLEAVLARVLGPLQAQLTEQGLAQAQLAKEFAEAKATFEARVVGVGKPPLYDPTSPESEPEAKATPPTGSKQKGSFEGFEKEVRELESEKLADKLFARFLVQQDAHKGSEKKLAVVVDSTPFLKTSLEFRERFFGSRRCGIWWFWICCELTNTSSSSQDTNS